MPKQSPSLLGEVADISSTLPYYCPIVDDTSHISIICSSIKQSLILSSLEPSPILLLAAYIIETARCTPSIVKRAYCNRVPLLQRSIVRLSLSGGCIYSAHEKQLWYEFINTVGCIHGIHEDGRWMYEVWSRGVYLCLLFRGGEEKMETRKNRLVVD